jgi:hypothetical protein
MPFQRLYKIVEARPGRNVLDKDDRGFQGHRRKVGRGDQPAPRGEPQAVFAALGCLKARVAVDVDTRCNDRFAGGCTFVDAEEKAIAMLDPTKSFGEISIGSEPKRAFVGSYPLSRLGVKLSRRASARYPRRRFTVATSRQS